jgi:RimJ/RimL family protein N-acetyltransferase
MELSPHHRDRDMTLADAVTERLILSPLDLTDCAPIQAAAGRRAVSDTMISIPHPFSARDAERYVRIRLGQMRRGRGVALCLRTRAEGVFCGLVELRAIDREHALAELSFWLSADAWGLGYMSEAIGAVLRLAFQGLGLNRIYAYHMVRNPASERVLARHGFRVEGVLQQRVRKWGVFEDVVLQALLKPDWLARDGTDR